jgi:hypothetical protein
MLRLRRFQEFNSRENRLVVERREMKEIVVIRWLCIQ